MNILNIGYPCVLGVSINYIYNSGLACVIQIVNIIDILYIICKYIRYIIDIL
mgnify:CR=1 FL=1